MKNRWIARRSFVRSKKPWRPDIFTRFAINLYNLIHQFREHAVVPAKTFVARSSRPFPRPPRQRPPHESRLGAVARRKFEWPESAYCLVSTDLKGKKLMFRKLQIRICLFSAPNDNQPLRSSEQDNPKTT